MFLTVQWLASGKLKTKKSKHDDPPLNIFLLLLRMRKGKLIENCIEDKKEKIILCFPYTKSI